MSSSALKLLAASGAKGSATYVDDVFSTYLYGSAHGTSPIVNDINLADDGGLVWIKHRTSTYSHIIFDTERGKSNHIVSNTTAGNSTSIGLASFNTNGFSFSGANLNVNSDSHVAWTFRKAPGFFDVVTYTGNGANRTIAHNLGSVPGMIIVKRTNAAENWNCYHRAIASSSPENYFIDLDRNAARDTLTGSWNNTAPTSTVFTVGNHNRVNGNGDTYVAYLFAHDAQEFGTDEDESIIKCGSYTGNGSSTGPIIDLGFEPQWVLIKNASGTGDWGLVDIMRGQTVNSSSSQRFKINTSGAEGLASFIKLNSTGFQLTASVADFNGNGSEFIYVAIRRPFKPAKEFAATDLFKQDNDTTTASPKYVSGFPVDFAFQNTVDETGYTQLSARLTGKQMYPSATDAEEGSPEYDYSNGYKEGGGSTNADDYGWMWRRAPGFTDVVTYTGNGSAGNTVSHNLGVVPELMIIKKRNQASNWEVFVGSAGPTKRIYLDYANAIETTSTAWNDTAPTATVFSLGTSGQTNQNGGTFVAYLFASLDGISKVGSYTGTGNNLNVDCGFSAGARFILIKRTDGTGDWYVYDSLRGIVAGNDPYLLLNSTAAQVTNTDYIDPLASGFTVTSSAPAALNNNGGTYIFYAIA
jgi:hypothetical protein